MRKAVRIAGGAVDVVGGVPPGAKLGDVGDTERDGTSSTEKPDTGFVLRCQDPRPGGQPVAVVQPAHLDPLLGAERHAEERLVLGDLLQGRRGQGGEDAIALARLLESHLEPRVHDRVDQRVHLGDPLDARLDKLLACDLLTSDSSCQFCWNERF